MLQVREGDVFGERFVVGKLIRRGGMGVTVRAWT